VDSETLFPSGQKYERELRDKNFKLEQERKEASRYVEAKMRSLAVLENRLLEEQASARVSIFGRKDASKTGPLEKQIAEIKRELTLDLFAAASTYLGFNVEESDLGL
jgi:adenylyl- and sulfurtransferase ThiI